MAWDILSSTRIATLRGHHEEITRLTFTPDGRRLISASADTTLLVWDAAAWDRPRPAPAPGAAELRAHWDALHGADAAVAFRSICALADAPQRSVPFLREQLLRPVAVDEGQLRRWVADLDAPRAAMRDQASLALAARIDQAAPLLRKLIAGRPSAEARSRAERLLAILAAAPVSPDRLRELRAVEVLERVGTPGARSALRDLAALADRSALAREAAAALRRLGG